MKKSVLFVLFALISVAGFSQITGWNAKVGMNFSNYTGDLDLNAKVGFKLGGGFEYAFTDTWSLQPSLFLTSKGAKKDVKQGAEKAQKEIKKGYNEIKKEASKKLG